MCSGSDIASVAWKRRLPAVSLHALHAQREGWYCQFLEEDLKTPLPKKLTFADVSKVRELAEKGGGFNILEARHAFNQGVEVAAEAESIFS